MSNHFEVRDLRKRNLYKVDDKFLNGYARFVGVYAAGVYNSLCRHANSKEQKCWPSIKKMSEELGISRPKVIQGIQYLEFWRIIKSQRVGKRCNNRYYLVDKEYWKSISEVNVIDFTEVNVIDFTGKQRLLHRLTTFTSNSKGAHSKETQRKEDSLKEDSLKEELRSQKDMFVPGVGNIPDL